MRSLHLWPWILCAAASATAQAANPSFNCSKVAVNSIETHICQSDTLAASDVQLSEGYRQARDKARNEHPPTLTAEQRGWIKGRIDCWKPDDLFPCISASYSLRIAELQARHALIQASIYHFYKSTEASTGLTPGDVFDQVQVVILPAHR
jgi:uncharacterized protein